MRLCYVNSGVPIVVKKKFDGLLNVTCVNPTQLKEVDHAFSFLKNVSDFVIEPEVTGCVGRMQNNLSDVAATDLNLRQAGPSYTVPVPWDPTTLYIASSYNETQYHLDQSNRGKSLLGVLKNIYAFEFAVYLVIAVLMAILITLSICHQLINLRRPSIRQKAERKRQRHAMYPFLTRTLVLIEVLSSFFLSTPFRCMYKTTQVIVDKPPLITNYEELIKFNASVSFSNLYVNIKSFLEPNEQNIRTRDIVFKMYKHFNSHELNGKPRTKKEILEHIKEARKLQFRRKLVLVGDDVFIEKALTIACKMTYAGELHRFYKWHDPNQREELTGWGLRNGFNDKELVKKLRWAFEMGVVDVRERRLARYLYNDFPLNEASRQQYYKQKLLCFDTQVRLYEPTETFSSGISFFFVLFTIAIFLFFIAFVILMIERSVHRPVEKIDLSLLHPKQRKRREKKSCQALIEFN